MAPRSSPGPARARGILVRVAHYGRTLKGSLPKKLAKEAANAGISLLPVVGTFASVASAGETVAESAKQGRSWHAALMKLRGASERP